MGLACTDMNKFNRISATVLAGMALFGVSGVSHSLGYGRPTSRAILGESLSVTVPIHVESANEISSECVAADVYFGDDKLAGAEVTAILLPGAGSERVIKVITRKFVNEPVITVYLTAGCNSKVTRKFVAFADPPSTIAPSMGLGEVEAPPVAYSSQAGKVTVGGLTVDTSDSTIEGAPFPETAPAATRARRSKKSTSVANGKIAGAVVASKGSTNVLQGAPSMAVSPNAQAQAARVKDEATLAKSMPGSKAGKTALPESKASSGERLMLDPADADAMIHPDLTMTASLQGKVNGDEASPEVKERRLAAAALWLAMNTTPEQLARDQQRVQDLEKRLAGLKQASDQSRQEVAQLQSRVQRAESAQNNSTLVYGLGGLALVLGGTVAALFLKDRRKKKGSEWWKLDASVPSDPGQDAPDEGSPLEKTLASFRPGPPKPDDGGHDVLSVSKATEPVADTVHRESAPTFNIPQSDKAAATLLGEAAARQGRPQFTEPPREVSVEELIDLEQQAEFFIVLGQDDAALDLLESHVQSTTGASPLPFLKLLEIYQRLGKRQDYERVQAEFNRRFNGYAPAWESDLLQGHSLPEYPGIVERLQDLWPVPAKAMDVLERSLTRPDAEAETFDLPAYRELLFLYAVARDLSERESEAREAVDLSLPFVDPTMVLVSSEPETIEPLMATRPVKAQPQAQPTISLDLSLDDLEPVAPLAVEPELPPLVHESNAIEFEHVDLNPHQPPDKS